GVPAGDRGRRVRAGAAQRDSPGGLLRVHAAAHGAGAAAVPDGTAASPLREGGLGGEQGDHPLLDPRDPVRAPRLQHAEDPVSEARRVGVLGLARSGRAAALLALAAGDRVLAAEAGDGPAVRAAAEGGRGAGWAESKVIIRFWILGILFALLAFSTLKIR